MNNRVATVVQIAGENTVQTQTQNKKFFQIKSSSGNRHEQDKAFIHSTGAYCRRKTQLGEQERTPKLRRNIQILSGETVTKTADKEHDYG